MLFVSCRLIRLGGCAECVFALYRPAIQGSEVSLPPPSHLSCTWKLSNLSKINQLKNLAVECPKPSLSHQYLVIIIRSSPHTCSTAVDSVTQVSTYVRSKSAAKVISVHFTRVLVSVLQCQVEQDRFRKHPAIAEYGRNNPR